LVSVGGIGAVAVLGDVDGLVLAGGADDPDAACAGGAGDPDANLASRAFNAIALFISLCLVKRGDMEKKLTVYVLLLP
jgi:hypothetical protein